MTIPISAYGNTAPIPQRTDCIRGGTLMTFCEIALLILCLIGVVYFRKNKKFPLMIACIAVALIMVFLLIATIVLLRGID